MSYVIPENLVGQLLISHPSVSVRSQFYQSVLLVVNQSDTRLLGVGINDPLPDLNLDMISRRLGIEGGIAHRLDGEHDPVWYGGPDSVHRIMVIHSTDWTSPTSIMLTPDLGVTMDISVLLALNHTHGGPQQYRACAGIWTLDGTEVQHQLLENSSLTRDPTSTPRPHSMWELAPALPELVFENSATNQWHRALEVSAKYQASHWFNNY